MIFDKISNSFSHGYHDNERKVKYFDIKKCDGLDPFGIHLCITFASYLPALVTTWVVITLLPED